MSGARRSVLARSAPAGPARPVGSPELSADHPRVALVRLLHTSDWHLGRSFHRVGMLEAQATFVDHLVEVVRAESVDVVLVAGDVYDRALPGVDVVELLDEALSRLVGAGATVVLTSGNHDSAPRLGFAARLLETAQVHIRVAVEPAPRPVLVPDRHGDVAIYPLPYLEPVLAAEPLSCTPGHVAVLGAAMDAVRADLSTRPGSTRAVASAHAFVVGGQVSDSERDISVGGVAAVPAALFDGVHYAALGHLHRRQQITATVRYSGSPLAYSFSEHGQVKGSLLVSLGRHGVEAVEPIDAPVPRPLALLRDDLDELLHRPDLADHEQAWCQVTLTDAVRPAHAMERLRTRFPHTLELRFETVGSVPGDRITVRRAADRSDLEICAGFLTEVRGRGPSEVELGWLREAMQALRLEQMEASGVAALRAEGRRRGASSLGAAPDPGSGAPATAPGPGPELALTTEASVTGEQVAFALGEAG